MVFILRKRWKTDLGAFDPQAHSEGHPEGQSILSLLVYAVRDLMSSNSKLIRCKLNAAQDHHSPTEDKGNLLRLWKGVRKDVRRWAYVLRSGGDRFELINYDVSLVNLTTFWRAQLAAELSAAAVPLNWQNPTRHEVYAPNKHIKLFFK